MILYRMSTKSHKNLKVIRFEGELLPKWAQLLDLAAMLCPVNEDVRCWFSTFTNAPGVADACDVIEHCKVLKAAIHENRTTLTTELQRKSADTQPFQVIRAWIYALETMIQAAQTTRPVPGLWRVRTKVDWKVQMEEVLPSDAYEEILPTKCTLYDMFHAHRFRSGIMHRARLWFTP